MRPRRRFQPSFDWMPTRIAPSGLTIGNPALSAESNPAPPPVIVPLCTPCTSDPNDPTDPPV
jgi:hypothetical protein